jgi:hypothetical protein
MRERFLIYGLRDPRSFEIRYVGRSTSGLIRPRAHRSAANREHTRKACWIKSLQKVGLNYEVVILETVDSASALNEAEIKWISVGRNAIGARFTNATAGGDGRVASFASEETKAKMRASSRGRLGLGTNSLETRLRIAAALRGRALSAETRARMSASARARSDRKPHSEATKQKIAASQRTAAARRSPEVRKKISDSVIASNKRRSKRAASVPAPVK